MKNFNKNKIQRKHTKLLKNVEKADKKFWCMPSTENYYETLIARDILENFEKENFI